MNLPKDIEDKLLEDMAQEIYVRVYSDGYSWSLLMGHHPEKDACIAAAKAALAVAVPVIRNAVLKECLAKLKEVENE